MRNEILGGSCHSRPSLHGAPPAPPPRPPHSPLCSVNMLAPAVLISRPERYLALVERVMVPEEEPRCRSLPCWPPMSPPHAHSPCLLQHRDIVAAFPTVLRPGITVSRLWVTSGPKMSW